MTLRLTPRRQRFVAEYLVDLNGTQAAIRAGYSPRTANEQAARLLAKASVSQAVAEGQARHLAKAEISAERVLEEVRRIAFSDVRGLFDGNNDLKPMRDLTPEQTAALAILDRHHSALADGRSISILRIRFWDKLRALEMLMKRFGLLTEKVEQSGVVQFQWIKERLERARERAALGPGQQ
jgi:phage terminase small subunit